jgi:hypothetical protein
MASELPARTVHALLPPGIHACSLETLRREFGGFQRSDRRPGLFKKLAEYVREVLKQGWSVIVDGSFVMYGVDEPEDIDLIVVLPADWDLTAEVRSVEYNLLSRKRVRKTFGFDVFAVRAGSPEEAQWTEFFMQVGTKWTAAGVIPPGTQKGIVRVIP